MRRRENEQVKRARAAAFSAVAAVVLLAPRAQGQEQAATAEALFREARQLVAQGHYAEACPKFAASQRLDPGYGTLYNLGECLVHQGKTASAWAAFQEAAALAQTSGQADRQAKAARAATALEGKLQRIVVSVAAPPPGVVVRRGGVVIDAAAWGSALPVDPGKHRIEASAPGKKDYALEIESGGPGTVVKVEIPRLQDLPPTLPAKVAPPPAAPDGAASRRVAAYVLGGVGVAGMVAGAVLGASAKSQWNEAQSHECRTSTLCSQRGVDLVNGAKAAATGANVGWIAGGALAAAGVVLLLTALPQGPKKTTGQLVVAPILEPRRGGLSVQGSF